MFDNPLEPCNSIFNHQLPQARDVKNLLSQLLNELTHKYDSWYVPQQMQTRERPVGSRNKAQNSTNRDPSAFELEEIRINSRRYGMYKRTGHNSQTCPNDMKHSVTKI
ncbi:31099_t:CDS:2 [Gigaspora margarita]|uniref:31099_t:CDS:1 n=1 Tax=Gigaspora margarita TaxID=4874 RepID=A0ABN7VKQ6_GIGMA|nr:31099_t:CDS:2 [Gigaspora margarita]